MTRNPRVLLLMHNAAERELIQRRLADVPATSIAVHADQAIAAMDEYQPVAIVLDDAHASTAPDSFLEVSAARRVRLITVSYPDFGPAVDDRELWSAVIERRA